MTSTDVAPRPRFHLAFPVTNLAATRKFFTEVIGAREGRVDAGSDPRWVDFDFFGHQISAHRVDAAVDGETPKNPVDGDQVPVRHFGVILPPNEWQRLADRLQELEVELLIRPRTRFKGQPGEQSTFFVVEPSGNTLEFKAFANDSSVFAHAPE